MLNHELVHFSLVTIIGVTVLLCSAKCAICQSDQSVLAHQYVAKGSDIETLDGHVESDVPRRDVDLYSGGEALRFNSLCIASYASCCA